MQRDSLVFEIIQKEADRQKYGIELIASENFVSESGYGSYGFCNDKQIC